MDWLKRNQKKVLAVLGVLLMIGFLVNPSVTSSLTGGNNMRGRPIGKIGKTTLYSDELQRSQNEWKMLAQSPMLLPSRGRFQTTSVLSRLGNTIISQVNDHPELFLLLWKDAERRGIVMSDDVVRTAIRNHDESMFGEMSYLPVPSRVTEDQFLPAARHYLEVMALRNLLNSDIKLSDPIWKEQLAAGQDISLDLVEFSASQYQRTVKPPTTQQVQETFEKYKNVQPAVASHQPDDPLGFAYEVPNRVKLQYIGVTHQQAMDAVRASKDVFTLDFDAHKYYYRNQDRFVRPAPPETAPATTAPATEPSTTQPSATQASTTQPSATQAVATTQPSTSQAVATTQPSSTTQASAPTTAPSAPKIAAAPTTRPFEEVKNEILDTLLAPEADALQKQIDDAIHARLTAGYDTYRHSHPAGPTTAPSTQAASAPTTASADASDFTSYAYLEQVAQDIQRLFHVLPQVRQIAEWEDAVQLAAEPGIGMAEADGLPFPQAATAEAAPFVAESARKRALQLWQPSQVFAAMDKATYQFRLTDASPAHPPKFAEVQARVEADAQTSLAFDAAQDAAKKFMESARHEGLTRAAVDDQRSIISTGTFSPMQMRAGIPNFHTDAEGTTTLAIKSHDLLTEATAANPHPITLIPLPKERRVLVAGLGDVLQRQPPEGQVALKLEMLPYFQNQGAEELAASYFSYAAVCARLDYHPEAPPKEASSD